MTAQEKLACRFRLKIYRIENGYSFEDLSNVLNVSSSSLRRIERGYVELSEHLFNSINNLLNFNKAEHKHCKEAIENHVPTLIRLLYYMEYDKAHRLFEKHFKEETDFVNCVFFLEYYLIKVAYLMLTRQNMDEIEPYVIKLRFAEDYFTANYVDLYLLMNGRYEMLKYNLISAHSYLEKHRSISDQPGFLAMNYYYYGILLSNSYKSYQKSLQYFSLAKQLFQQQNNFKRIVDLKLIEQRLLIYINNHLRFKELNEETLQYAEIHSDQHVRDYSIHFSALYLVSLSDYQGALNHFNQYQIDIIEYFFHKAYVLFRLYKYREAKEIIQRYDRDYYDASQEAVVSGYQAMLSKMNNEPTNTVLKKYKHFADLAYQTEVYPLIRIGFKLYIELLEKSRKYKEAYEYSKKMIEIIELTMK